RACLGIDLRQVHDREIPTELLVARNAFVVIDEVTAAVQDQLSTPQLDAFRMMRRMAVHDVYARRVDQPVGEAAVLRRNAMSPIPAPMNRCDDHVAGALCG